MKRILIIALVLLSTLGYSQRSEKDLKIRNSLTLQDSSVTNITTGDTLATKEWTVANTLSMTGNDTEVFFNNGGILGSNPSFTYDSTEHTLNFDTLKLGIGESVSWNGDEYTLNIETGLGPVLQVGQEIYILIYNNTGSTITNTTVLRPVSAVDVGGILFPTVEKAIASVFSGVEGTIMVSTMDIPDGTVGVAVRFGRARGTNTSGFSPGDALWISAVDSGVIVNVRPEFPNYDISIGGSFNSAAAPDGEIFISVTRDIWNTFINFHNGTFRETFDFLITATGGVITGTLTPTNGHPDMTMLFSDGFQMLDTDPGATIVLTAGTDQIPQLNYVYIPISTKVLTLSTSGYPLTEHIKVGKSLLKSASFVERRKASINQNVNDPVANTSTFQGQLSAITKRIRLENAKHISGTEGVATVSTGPTPDSVTVSITSGRVAQLNEHVFAGFDMALGDSIEVVNYPSALDSLMGNINEILVDANNVTLNNTSFSFVTWAAQNKTGEPSPTKLNLPSGSYAFASPANAVSDALNYSNYTIPDAYIGVGFLIARFTFTYKNDAWVLYDTEDLRKREPNVSSGGGAGGGGVTTFTGLTDTESSYTAYEFQIANAGATALESSSGLTYNDSLNVTGNIIGDTIKANGYIGIGVSHPLSALHLNKGVGSLSTGIIFTDNSGIFENTANELYIKLGNLNKWKCTTSYFGGVSTSTAALYAFTATATAPSLLMRQDDPSTGIGWAGAFDGRLIAGGKSIAAFKGNVTEQFIINPQGDLTGTAAAPSLAFGDGNSGFYESIDNTMILSVNSSPVFYFTETYMRGASNNRFNINTGVSSSTVPSYSFRGNTVTGLGLAAINELSLIANSIEAMRLTEDSVLMDSSVHIGKDLIVDGSVGINTIPDELLHILSSTNSSVLEVQSTFIGGDARINLYADNTGLSQLRFGNQDDVNIGLITYDHSDNSMALRTNNATRLSIDSNGDVLLESAFGFSTAGITTIDRVLDEDGLTSDSDVALATQQSIKKYVDDNVGGVRVDTAHISYTNTSQTTIVTLPDNAVLSDIALNVTVGFNDSGTDVIDIGTTGSATRYITANTLTLISSFTSVSATNIFSNSDNVPDRMSGSTNITFQYTGQNTDATQGEATVYIYYTIF